MLCAVVATLRLITQSQLHALYSKPSSPGFVMVWAWKWNEVSPFSSVSTRHMVLSERLNSSAKPSVLVTIVKSDLSCQFICLSLALLLIILKNQKTREQQRTETWKSCSSRIPVCYRECLGLKPFQNSAKWNSDSSLHKKQGLSNTDDYFPVSSLGNQRSTEAHCVANGKNCNDYVFRGTTGIDVSFHIIQFMVQKLGRHESIR